jgi:hypothetical protein
MVIIIYETQGMLQLQKSIAIFCKYFFGSNINHAKKKEEKR